MKSLTAIAIALAVPAAHAIDWEKIGTTPEVDIFIEKNSLQPMHSVPGVAALMRAVQKSTDRVTVLRVAVLSSTCQKKSGAVRFHNLDGSLMRADLWVEGSGTAADAIANYLCAHV